MGMSHKQITCLMQPALISPGTLAVLYVDAPHVCCSGGTQGGVYARGRMFQVRLVLCAICTVGAWILDDDRRIRKAFV